MTAPAMETSVGPSVGDDQGSARTDPATESDPGRRRRRMMAAQAAASAGGIVSLAAVLLGTPALASQAHAVRAHQVIAAATVR